MDRPKKTVGRQRTMTTAIVAVATQRTTPQQQNKALPNEENCHTVPKKGGGQQ
jgi:hypothetical protein